MKNTIATASHDGNEREYEVITLDNMRDFAKKSAYCTTRMLVNGNPRRVKDANGATLDYDGNSGANDMIARIFYAFHFCMASAVKRIEEAEKAREIAPCKQTLDVLQDAVKQGLSVCASDADDCISVAFEALYTDFVENGGEECSADAYDKACRAVRAYIYSEETATTTKTRRKYDKNGVLLEMNDYKYIRFPHLHIEDEETGEVIDVNDGINRLMSGLVAHATIQAVVAILTPTQKRIVAQMAKGRCYETIAKRLKISPVSVRRHCQCIREKALPIINA
jgi:DNA-binding CsgD family transcriptional regulator